MLHLIVPMSCAVAGCDDTAAYPDFTSAWAGPVALAIVGIVVLVAVVVGIRARRSRR
ncbi:hypothetical protein [Microbacterium candidum]|uniref:Uncharacterized protein n=1 Tax=Microbacterium candidum TaxID=3041922 RepID=A0ABT7MUN8_9MICO|nr:hypothetical protein [Microbacterium sp. ASV49]MDL9978171.1 hypothetical protein [Microbacterium sp. ASV49]